MDPRLEHRLNTIFKRRIGTTVTVAIALTIASYFISLEVAVVLGVATFWLIIWAVVYIVSG